MTLKRRTIVIPMAGQGRRFREAGVTVPKPLIDVGGVPMYVRAVRSLNARPDDRLVFVCLAEHCRDRGLDRDIHRRFADSDHRVVTVDEVTGGQLETVLASSDAWIDGPITIFNADTIAHHDLPSTLEHHGSDVDGVFGVFRAAGDHWSFARIGADGYVIETAEKRRISPWASTGLYHFSDVHRFEQLARAMIGAGRRSGGEFYVAPLYNDLIASGGKVVVDAASEVVALGTPEELQAAVAALRSGGRPSDENSCDP